MDAEPERRSVIRHVTNLFFGIALPAACLAFDPIVFRSDFGRAMFGSYAVVGYLATALGFVSLSSWTILRVRPAFHSGLLLGAAIFAACLGLVLFPLSAFALLLCIGVFGFTPLFTAWVYFREALAAASTVSRTPATVANLVAGLLLSCGLPWAAQWGLNREIEQVITEDAPSPILQAIGPLLPEAQFDSIVWRWRGEENPTKRESLAGAYRMITHTEIGSRIITLD